MIAIKTHAEPPDSWRFEIRKPLLWQGFYTSAPGDGETWFSESLGRELGSVEGEARPIGWLRGLARGRRIERGDLVIAAARKLVAVAKLSGDECDVIDARLELEDALLIYDGKAAPPPEAPDPTKPLYVGDGGPRVRAAEESAGAYLPTEDPE
mgnify:CR=1 FL=1